MLFDGDDENKTDAPKPDEGGPEAGQYDTDVSVPGNDSIENSQL
jgi:hypothetical protein